MPKVSKCRQCGKPLSYEPIADPFNPNRSMEWEPTICDPCEVKMVEHRNILAAEEMRKVKERHFSGVCPPIYCETEPARIPAQYALQRVLRWSVGPRGLVLHGDTSRGKTRAAWLLLRQLYFRDNVKFEAMSSAEFARRSSDSASNGHSEVFASTLERVDLLFIDDLGKGKMTDRNESDLFDILEHRFSHKRPVLLTTNAVGDELEKRFDPDRGRPLVRRLREFCEAINF